MKKILAADLGGTNSRFACFEFDEASGLRLAGKARLKTAEHSSFGQLLEALWDSGLKYGPDQYDIAVLAVPGPVIKGVYCHPANIAWDINVSKAEVKYGLKNCRLINDFAAQAYACRTPVVDSGLVIQEGHVDQDGALIVIGAGTGLGHCALVPVGGSFVTVNSEGGHKGFPFVGEREAEYERFIRETTGHPFCYGDLVVTGLGLTLLHRFLTGEELTPHQVAATLTPESETLEWYARFYGRAARDYALTVVPLGGVYIAGGITAKNPILVQSPHFINEFRLSVEYPELLAMLPVILNGNDDSGLYGAAFFAQLYLNGKI